MIKGEDYKIVLGDNVKERMESDPAAAEAVRNVIADLRQALDGIDENDPDALIEAMRKAGGTPIDPDSDDLPEQFLAMMVESVEKIADEEDDSRFQMMQRSVTQIAEVLEGLPLQLVGGVLSELVGMFLCSFRKEKREEAIGILIQSAMTIVAAQEASKADEEKS